VLASPSKAQKFSGSKSLVVPKHKRQTFTRQNASGQSLKMSSLMGAASMRHKDIRTSADIMSPTHDNISPLKIPRHGMVAAAQRRMQVVRGGRFEPKYGVLKITLTTLESVGKLKSLPYLTLPSVSYP
jgi:hypothetical protein